MPAKDLKTIAIAAVAAITVMTLMALAVPVFAAGQSPCSPRFHQGVAPQAASPSEIVANQQPTFGR